MMRPGDRAGDYVVEREIGRGGMGVVYRARHHIDDDLVALKVLRPELVAQPNVVRRFFREVDAVRDVEHPNVVRFIAAGLISIGQPFLACELLDGVPLASLVGAGRSLDVPSVVHLIKQVASGLDAVHAANIVHRDISPTNIVVTRDATGVSRLKIIDFGVAKLLDSVVGVSTENMNLGSPLFRAPEQERESASVNHRADIYSLAVTAFLLLSGGLMPWGVGPTATLLERKALDPAPDLRASHPSLSIEQAAVLRTAMAREPMKRWASASEFAKALATASNVGDKTPDLLDIAAASGQRR